MIIELFLAPEWDQLNRVFIGSFISTQPHSFKVFFIVFYCSFFSVALTVVTYVDV